MFIGLLGGYYLIRSSSKPSIKACTKEAKICPDGSSVGRTGPNCDFSPCPQISTVASIPANQNSTVSMFGSSMNPNFINNTSYSVDRNYYRTNDPKRGDVVLLIEQATNGPIEVIKRIIGLQGEKIQIKDGQVYINGNILPEPYIMKEKSTNLYSENIIKEGQAIDIPPNQYFVMGDNREHSSDSRDWGLLKKENIIGKL